MKAKGGVLKLVKQFLAVMFFLFSAQLSFSQEVPMLAWAKSMGGSQGDFGQDIAIDVSGNVYSTGRHYATGDFDPGIPIFNLTTPGGDHNVFVSKVDKNGNFVWAKSMGGIDTDYGYSIAVDASGNVFTTGHFAGTADFDPGPGTFNLTAAGNDDIFVSKLDTDGNFVWAVRIGSSFLDYAYNMTIDNNGNIYITGLFRGTVDFDPGSTTFNITSSIGTANNAYILKLDTDSNFVWAKAFVGSNTIGNAVFVDALFNVYAVGYFVGTTDFNPGTSTFNLTASGIEDAFITKLDVNGDFVWAKSFGGSNNTRIADVAVDGGGSIYTTGYFLGTTDFDPGAGIDNHTSVGTTDIFISKLDSNGNLIWAKPLGGTSSDRGIGIITDAGGNVLTAGRFGSTVDFDPGPGVFNLTPAGGFLSKLDSNGNHVWAVRAGSDAANAITIDPSGTIYLAGNFVGTDDFDYGTCTSNLISAGQTDIFIQKINIGSLLPPPTIISFTPTSGPVGSSVVITGTNFDTTPTNNAVTFNGTVAVVTGSTATSIITTVPAGATTGKISVNVNCLTATSATDFTVGTPPNFITQWNLATAGSGATQLTFGTATSGTVNYTWQQLPSGASGSGSWSGPVLTITGLPAGATIRLQIAPTNFQRIIINTGTDRNRLTRVEQWGTIAWTSMQNAFVNCSNLQVTATDVPDLSGVTNMSGMFRGCNTLNSPSNIGSWNTSTVTDMSALFSLASSFNQNISSWNTGAVTNMSNLFADAAAFNQDIGIWNTAAVTNMTGMFAGATVFNRNIGAWNTSAVTTMNSMFFSAYVFNQNITGWNTASVTNMASMFGYAYDFNQNIGIWNTAAVTNMSRMFEDAFDFNQNIGTWNTSAVTNMRGMFIDAYAFNQNIGTWNTASVTDMSRMFDFATAFNQNIGVWNTAAVTDMSGMFADASGFNQNIGTWSLNPTVNLTGMFNNSGLDCANYSATLIGWSANSSTPNGRALGANGRQYGTNAVAARTNLDITKSWTITGDTPSGVVCGSVAVPTITSLTPTSGPIGTTVTIIGTNFSTTPANNTVRFNGTIAVVSASTTTSITTSVPTGATTGKISVTVAANTATSANDFTVTSVSNQPPVISSTAASAPINGKVTIELLSLLSDPDDNLDLSTLALLSNTSEQGAAATLNASSELELDYGNTFFSGIDRVSIEVCDLLSACSQQVLSIEVGGDVNVYNAVSPNGDGKNEFLVLKYIETISPQNQVSIYNRWGDEVFTISDYDNKTRVFVGLSTSGNKLPSGTYFYKITFANNQKTMSGFLSLR
ncbi:MAG: BspA family leucine-rich repeat surface protein [Cyclobacteriaceae bacterium]|jgi:gliding motility-associated-like protein|nr:BspA family leucine-rich repeat surface protein [Flammeovirgaceae bacterium]